MDIDGDRNTYNDRDCDKGHDSDINSGGDGEIERDIDSGSYSCNYRNRHGASYLDRKKCRWKQRVAQRKSSRVYIHQSIRETEK